MPTCSSWPPTSTASTTDWGTPDQRRLDRVTPERAARRRASPPARWAPRSRRRRSSSKRTGQAGRHRLARRHRADRRRVRRAPTSSPAVSDRPKEKRDERVRRPFRGRQAAQGHGPSAGSEPAAPDTRRTTTSCCSTTCSGSSGPSTSTTSSSRRCASAASRCFLLSRPPRRGAGRQRRRRARGSSSSSSSEYTVGWSLVDEIRAPARGLTPDAARQAPHRRPHRRRGGSRPRPRRATASLIGAALDDPSTFVLPPLPNTLFTRDSSCWIYGGVSINPMYWPARRREAYNVAAIYQAPSDVRRRPTSSSGTRPRAPTGGSRPPTSAWPRWRVAT